MNPDPMPTEPDPHKHTEDCAPRRVLDLFSSKWTSMVLHVLQIEHGGTSRTAPLHRSLPGISQKMLTQTLRTMERDGLIVRRVLAGVPPGVEYSLTPLGCEFIEPIEMLYDWARRHSDALDRLQQSITSRRAG